MNGAAPIQINVQDLGTMMLLFGCAGFVSWTLANASKEVRRSFAVLFIRTNGGTPGPIDQRGRWKLPHGSIQPVASGSRVEFLAFDQTGCFMRVCVLGMLCGHSIARRRRCHSRWHYGFLHQAASGVSARRGEPVEQCMCCLGALRTSKD